MYSRERNFVAHMPTREDSGSALGPIPFYNSLHRSGPVIPVSQRLRSAAAQERSTTTGLWRPSSTASRTCPSGADSRSTASNGSDACPNPTSTSSTTLPPMRSSSPSRTRAPRSSGARRPPPPRSPSARTGTWRASARLTTACKRPGTAGSQQKTSTSPPGLWGARHHNSDLLKH
jgi:hypothetical protein